MNIQGWEWVIILVIVVLVFGVGRISKLGKELGSGVKNFREGVREGSEGKSSDETTSEISDETTTEVAEKEA